MCGRGEGHDVTISSLVMHLDSLLKLLPAGWEPDRILVLDNSAPLWLDGLATTDIPTAFYSVDTHHHARLHAHLCDLFDLVYIAQRDYLPAFTERGHAPKWLPLYASRFVESSPERRWQATFVGTMNQRLNPARVGFFEALQQRVPVHVTEGRWWEIFPLSELVVNQTVKGDLNFRVFEAMMCGTLLLTERSGNGLLELFREGEHLVTYEKGNVEDAARCITALLADLPRCRRIAAAGREEILARHLPRHRAATILEDLGPLQKRPAPRRRFSAAANFTTLGSQVYRVFDGPTSRPAFVVALRSADEALRAGEAITDDYAFHTVSAILRYDEVIGSGAGHALLLKLLEAFPSIPIFAFAAIRSLLNRGQRSDAAAIGRRAFGGDSAQIFEKAEEVITTLLSEMGTAGSTPAEQQQATTP